LEDPILVILFKFILKLLKIHLKIVLINCQDQGVRGRRK